MIASSPACLGLALLWLDVGPALACLLGVRGVVGGALPVLCPLWRVGVSSEAII